MNISVPISVMACTVAMAQSYNLKAPIAVKPALLTSVGQSADIEMVKVVMDRVGIPLKIDGKCQAAALASGGARTLVLAIGGSTKGLGAAGISPDTEIIRVKAVIGEAKKLGMKIIGVHVGGIPRRGELSDKFINAAVPQCDYVIVVADGNKDGLFNRLCAAGKIPLDAVEKIISVGDPLAKAFIK